MAKSPLINVQITGQNGAPILADVYFPENETTAPIVTFAHGYKGFKDWGHFRLLPFHFNQAGFIFIKFNFALNGGTPEQPIDFPNLNNFAMNTFTKELADYKTILDWIENELIKNYGLQTDSIFTMGHSRGGAISIIHTYEDERIKALCTWASLAGLDGCFPSGKERETWKKEGIYHVKNTRTGQLMPHLYEFFEDYDRNRKRLDVGAAYKKIQCPCMIIHGTSDASVKFGEALKLSSYNQDAELIKLEGATHTFGGYHPYPDNSLPKDCLKAVNASIDFFLRHSN